MSNSTVSGSCLCGAVTYEVSGDALRFSHCHCSRCRKATGTGHATNLLLTPVTGIRWLSGVENLLRFKVLEAERYYTCFCGTCGSPMPREVPEIDAVLIPAGSLDTSPPIQPQHHIFWGSKADWSCEAQGLPTYTEYP
ncbi:MAG: GFA family protein [bacterium]